MRGCCVVIQPFLERAQRGAGADIVLPENLLDGDEIIIAQALEFPNRTARGLVLGALDHAIDQGFGELGRFEFGPRPLEARAELRQHMPHAALAARKVVDQIRAHCRPAQAGSINDGLVEFTRGGHPVIHQVKNFAPQRFLQAIGQVPRHFAPHVQRMHADIGKEPGRRIDGALRGFQPADQLHQGQQVHRIERMRHAEAFGRDHVALQIGRREARSARRHDDIRRGVAADLGKHALLQGQLFRNVLLNEIGALRHELEIRGERESALGRQRREGQPRQGRLGVAHRTAYPLFHFRLDVRRCSARAAHPPPMTPVPRSPSVFTFRMIASRERPALCNVTSIIYKPEMGQVCAV